MAQMAVQASVDLEGSYHHACILLAFSAKVSVAAFQLETHSDKRECSTSWGKLFDEFSSLLPSELVFGGTLAASSGIAWRASLLWEFTLLGRSCSWTVPLPHSREIPLLTSALIIFKKFRF